MSDTQEWALARWREEAAAGDPPVYSTGVYHGHRYVWVSVRGNPGWHRVVDGRVVPMSNPYHDLSPWLCHKQKRKLMEALA